MIVCIQKKVDIKFKPIKGADHFYENFSNEFTEIVDNYIKENNLQKPENKKIILLQKLKKNNFDVVILAVPHKEIVSKGIKNIRSYLKPKNILISHFNEGSRERNFCLPLNCNIAK